MPYLLTNPSISQWTLGNVIRARNILLLLLNNFLKKNNTAFHLSNKTTWVLCEVAASMSLRSVVMLEKLKIPWRLKVSFCTNDYRGIRTLYADANKARFPFKRNRLRWQAANHGCHCFDRVFGCIPIGWRLRLLREIFASGNHDWLLANASACVSCSFRLRNARNATDCVWMETGLNIGRTRNVEVDF